MARKKRQALRKITLHITLEDEQALNAAAATLDRTPAWILGKLCHLSVGTLELSVEIRRWLRGDTGWDVGLPGDEPVLMTIENPDPPVVRVPRRKTVAEDPPTRSEVEEYVREKGYRFDAEEFWAFYDANGWKQGNKPLVNWRSACVTWQKTWAEKHGGEAAVMSDWGKNRPKELDEPPVDDRTAPMFTGLEEGEREAEEENDSAF